MWHVEVIRGDAGAFHARELPDPLEPTVWWFEVDAPALVLGSSEPMAHVDLDACRRAGVDVVRRRSGGGSVLVEPEAVHWVDVLLPRADPSWVDDVSRSAWWLGDAWQRALLALGVGGTAVHRGPMVHSQWSSHVCFAGVGGGEVVMGERKVVGISQRRTRAGARYQCIVYRSWRPQAHAELLSPPAPTVAEIAELAVDVDVTAASLRSSLLVALPPR